MAKRKGTSIADVLAFVALIVAAVVYLLQGIQKGFDVTIFDGRVMNVLEFIKQGSLLAAVLLAAYRYACTLSKVWFIIYVVLAVIAILGFFGFCRGLF